MALTVLGMAAFTILGGAMVLYADGLVEKAAGVLSIVFFGGFGDGI